MDSIDASVTNTATDQQQIQTLTANGSTIQYVTDGNPEQAAAAVLQAVFGTTASIVPPPPINHVVAGGIVGNTNGCAQQGRITDISQGVYTFFLNGAKLDLKK